MVIDLAQFADPVNPDNDTIAQVIGGIILGASHDELLAHALSQPALRIVFDTLNTRFSQPARIPGRSELEPEPELGEQQRLNGGDGNDILFIGHGDLQKNINGGSGHNLGIIVGDKGVTLNLAQTKLGAVLGGSSNDILIGGGRSTVMIEGGPGSDIIIGGAANDVLLGGDGDDLIDGGAGSDILYGGSGRDQLLGSIGDDRLSGGAGDDRLAGGTGNDILSGDAGDDTLEGSDGTDMAEYRGSLADYRIFRLDALTLRVADSRFGRDGSDTLRDIERLNFTDWWAVSFDRLAPIPVDDVLVIRKRIDSLTTYRGHALTNAYLIRGERLIANDLSLSGKKISLRTLIDDKDRDVPPETWALVSGGQALLTSSGDVIYQSSGTRDIIDFRYRIADATGNRGAVAARAGKTVAVEMWAAVRLVDSEPSAVAANSRRECSESCTLDPAEIELVLTGKDGINGTGNDLPNTLIGNVGSNVLDGGRGPDVMRGGPGNDTYFVDHPGDQVIEKPNEGSDTVWSAVENYILPANVENLTLAPSVRAGRGNNLDNHLSGSDLDNVLEGGSGNDVLNGGKGADRMIGSLGDDVYVVDDSGDEVIELPDEGRDTVMAGISYTLPANVENLTLTGLSAIDGIGNELDNQIFGNVGANILKGGAGNDWLEGGAGDDILYGDTGNDVYIYYQAKGHDTIIEDDPTSGKMDTLRLPVRKHESFWFWRQEDDLNIGLDSKNWVTIRHWYRGPAHRIERIEAGGYVLAPEGAEALVIALSEFVRPADGKSIPPDEFKQKLGPLIDKVWRRDEKSAPTPAGSSARY